MLQPIGISYQVSYLAQLIFCYKKLGRSSFFEIRKAAFSCPT